jgi:hypothetical protein
MLAIAAADPGKYPEPDIFFGDDDDENDDWYSTFVADHGVFRNRRRG